MLQGPQRSGLLQACWLVNSCAQLESLSFFFAFFSISSNNSNIFYLLASNLFLPWLWGVSYYANLCKNVNWC